MAHNHMNLKGKKNRKILFKIRIFFYSLVIYLSFSYTFYYSFRDGKKISNEEFINLLVKSGNANVISDYRIPNLVNITMKIFMNIDFTKPKTLLNSSILIFGDSNKHNIKLEYSDDYSNMEELESISDYINDPNPKESLNPVIYIYNSHQLENYNSDKLDVYGITPNVMMASYVLREKLGELGISAIVEDANMSEILSKNGWDYSYSYQASRSLIVDKMKNYGSLKYFIDIHRDSVGKNYTTVSINNVNYAKILFVIGQDFNGWESNYQFALKLHQMIENRYQGLSRGIMKKSGMNVNGVYNQDVSSHCILLEVGGVDNHIEEVYQTMNVLADILSQYVKEN